jgi:hypothetical protein
LEQQLKNLKNDNDLLISNNEMWTSKWADEKLSQLKEIEFLKKSNSAHKRLHEIVINQNKELQAKLKMRSEKVFTKAEAIDEFKRISGNLLTATQLKILVTGKKKTIWNVEDISRAFALRFFSHQAYTYFRDELNYPLPGLSTLRKYAAKFIIRGM